MDNLVHLIYASRASRDFSKEELLQLLAKVRSKNDSLDVTGMLLYENGDFLQVLEGEEEVIESLYRLIACDSRHMKVVKIAAEAIAERQFEDWSMGYASLSRKELNRIDGLNDFFDSKSCLLDLDSGRAKKILTAFEKGRWRLS